MANLIVDGFDWFPAGLSSADRARLWAANELYAIGTASPADVETGRFGFGQAMAINNNGLGSNISYNATIGAPIATGFVGGALFVYNDNSGAALIQFYDSVNDTWQLTVTFEPNGVVKAYRGGGPLQGGISVLLGTSIAGVYQQNEWFHFEIKATIDNSAGFLEVRVNTVPVLQLTGIDSQNTAVAGFDGVVLGSSKATSSRAHFSFDDFFVNDTTTAQNNTWSGNLRVYGMPAIANGATDNLTIGGSAPAATNWQSVLNNLLDDTKYVYSATVGNLDYYQPNPVVNGPLVRSLQVRMGLRQDDATQRVARAQLRIGGVAYPGAVDQFTNQTYTFYKERWGLSPATGVTFTGSEVNGLQFGVKVQA